MWVRPAIATVLLIGLVVAANPVRADPGPALAVDASADQRAISPEIYGLNFADATLAGQIGLPVNRWGGDVPETYNYVLGSQDTGAGNYFENLADCFDKCTGDVYPPAYQAFVAGNQGRGTRSLMQLPLMGYIAKDAPEDHPATCGFPKSAFPNQQAFDPFDPNCGNGFAPNGDYLFTDDPTRSGKAFNHTYVAAFAADLQGRGVNLFGLGNEPMLWRLTHRDLRRADEHETNAELISKFTAAAAAIKAQQPAAELVGPSEWGWIGYHCDGASYYENGGQCYPPQGANPFEGTPAVVAFLDAMRAHEQQHGVRLLHYFDLHYYPQSANRSTDETRSLWDPTYTDPSYVNAVVRLIPRMREWVDAHYPGTKLAITEWNFDAGNAQAALGTIMAADALGIFAREGLDMATMFDAPKAENLVADAFRLYRNYNGNGARFGGTYVRSTSADQGRVAVYGALRASDRALTVAVINKATTVQTTKLSLASFTPGGAAQVFQWTGSGIKRVADMTVRDGALTADLPPRSMTLFAVPPVGGKLDEGGGGGGTGGGDTGPGGGDTGPGGGGPGGGGTPGATLIKLRKATSNADGSVTLQMGVPSAGRLTGTATVGRPGPRAARVVTLARGTVSSRRAGTVRLRVKLTVAGRKYLRTRRRGVKATVKVAFKPRTGATVRRSLRATFRVKRRR